MSEIMLSAGVTTNEIDFKTYVVGISETIPAVVGGGRKGPIGAKVISGTRQLLDTYGDPHPDDYGIQSALRILARSGQIVYNRVASATAAKAVVGVTGTDALVFSSKDPNSIANGYKITYTVPTVDKLITVTITDKDGLVVERYENASIDPLKEDIYIEEVFLRHSEFNVEHDPAKTIAVAGNLTLAGGKDGISDLVANDIVGIGNKGLQAFTNPDVYDINVLTTPGWSDASVINAATDVAEGRGDCIYIADVPLGLKPADAVDWSNGEGTYKDEHQPFNSSYSALYWPWIKVDDIYSGKQIWLPPSAFVVAQFAHSDSVSEPWFAPAGLKRGKFIEKVVDIEYHTTKSDRDLLYGRTNIINPIMNFKGEGVAIWGQKTTLRRKNTFVSLNGGLVPLSTDRVNVRRLTCLLKKTIAASTAYLAFEQNDEYLWNEWKDMVQPVMDSIKAKRGMYEYRLVMDATTVTPDDIDQYRCPGKVYYKPTKSAEFLPIDFIITPTGATFENQQ